MVFGTAKSVLFIEVSSFQGVLIRGDPLYSTKSVPEDITTTLGLGYLYCASADRGNRK